MAGNDGHWGPLSGSGRRWKELADMEDIIYSIEDYKTVAETMADIRHKSGKNLNALTYYNERLWQKMRWEWKVSE